MQMLVSAALFTLTAYASVGLVFALWFVIRGHRRLDAAHISPWGRVVIFPASAALWPLLLVRALTAHTPLNAPSQEHAP